MQTVSRERVANKNKVVRLSNRWTLTQCRIWKLRFSNPAFVLNDTSFSRIPFDLMVWTRPGE